MIYQPEEPYFAMKKGTRVFDLIFHQYKNYPQEVCLSHKVGNQWKSYSTKQMIGVSSRIALGMLASGVKKGDKIGLISESRPEWNFVDLACQLIGAVSVPMYPSLGSKDYLYIFKQAELDMLFVSSKDIYTRVKPLKKAFPNLAIFSFDKLPQVAYWKQIHDLGVKEDFKSLKSHQSAVSPSDLLTIIYTSGTTGSPKGVMLTHQNIVSNVMAIKDIPQLNPGEKALSFLPINHIYERTILYSYYYVGVSIFYAESMEAIGDNLKEIKPHTFSTVPRLLEKVYDKIIAKGADLGGVKRGIFNWAISLGLKYDPNEDQGALYNRQLKTARNLVFSKWQEALGGNIKSIQCGAAALQARLMRVFWAAEIRIVEGYGLTETSPVVTANRLDDMRVGSVGKLVDGVQVQIADDGEILVKGPNVMKGYYKQKALTESVLSENWFKTGDVGYMDQGFLKITDRKKELFKTSGGLYIAPQQIENKLKESLLIDQAMVIGDGKKFPAALIVPNFDALAEEASKRFILMTGEEDVIKDEQIIKLFEKEIQRISAGYGKWEKIKEFRIITDAWSLETGELTPTLKLKRRVIMDRYQSLINEIYKEDGSHLFDDIKDINENEVEKEIAELLKK
ncbi:MAG: long-chain acyl-CoA synthetase [Cyclobacteriaceae bacterium]